MRGHLIDGLVHGVRGAGAFPDLDHFRLVLEAACEGLDFLGKGGGEHQRLAAFGQSGRDLFDSGQETHVEHAVRFIEDENFECAEVDSEAAGEVEQAAGGGDDDVDAFLQGFDLRGFIDAAVDGGDS